MTTTIRPPSTRERTVPPGRERAVPRPILEPQLEIDPRIRQRWMDTRRAAGRRRLKIVSVALSVVFAALVVLGVLHSPAMRVRHVRIFGVTSSELPQLSAAAGFDHQRLMIDINVSDVARALEAIPWVGTAEVTRTWPSTVRISVTSRTAVAQVLRSTSDPALGVALVDRTGRVLAVRSAASTSLESATLPFLHSVRAPGAPGTWLWGAPGAPKPSPGSSKRTSSGAAKVSSIPSTDTAEMLQTAAAIPAPIIGRVNSVGIISGQLEVMVGSTEVVLGTTSDLAAKMVSLQTVVSEVDLSAVSQVDLEVPDRPALTPTPQATSVSPTSGG